jgi:hypothetical protein
MKLRRFMNVNTTALHWSLLWTDDLVHIMTAYYFKIPFIIIPIFI